eukprot:3864322-Pleurochrysis_carterae.AAC.1
MAAQKHLLVSAGQSIPNEAACLFAIFFNFYPTQHFIRRYESTSGDASELGQNYCSEQLP